MNDQAKPQADKGEQDHRGPIPLADRRKMVMPTEKPAQPIFRDWASI